MKPSPLAAGSRRCAVALILALLALLSGACRAAGPLGFDDLDGYDQSRWARSDGWTNGNPFYAGWRGDHITFDKSIMTLTLDNVSCPGGCSGRPYASGEYRSVNYYGYGCFEARLRVAPGVGRVTALFSYNGGPSNTPPGGNGQHNEIDLEFLGRNTREVQLNFFANGRSAHEHTVVLNYDAATDFHNYGFKWTANGIDWYIDGSPVHSVPNRASDPTPDADPSRGGPQKIILNLWPCVGLDAWCGSFAYAGPSRAQYDWVRYQAGDACTFSKS